MWAQYGDDTAQQGTYILKITTNTSFELFQVPNWNTYFQNKYIDCQLVGVIKIPHGDDINSYTFEVRVTDYTGYAPLEGTVKLMLGDPDAYIYWYTDTDDYDYYRYFTGGGAVSYGLFGTKQVPRYPNADTIMDKVLSGEIVIYDLHNGDVILPTDTEGKLTLSKLQTLAQKTKVN
jgi:hypothetical protein